MDFNQNKKTLNKELEQFCGLLNEILPRYSELIKKCSYKTRNGYCNFCLQKVRGALLYFFCKFTNPK